MVTTDIHVERRRNHTREIAIYDRYGRVGDMSLTEDEARFVKHRLEEVLDDD